MAHALIPALQSLRQENQGFKARLCYIVSLKKTIHKKNSTNTKYKDNS